MIVEEKKFVQSLTPDINHKTGNDRADIVKTDKTQEQSSLQPNLRDTVKQIGKNLINSTFKESEINQLNQKLISQSRGRG